MCAGSDRKGGQHKRQLLVPLRWAEFLACQRLQTAPACWCSGEVWPVAA